MSIDDDRHGSIAISEAEARVIADVLQALSDPLRVRIVSYLASTGDGRARVSELAALAAVTQPTVSHHLRVLRDAGLLQSTADGTARLQEVTPGIALELASLFTGILAMRAVPLHEDLRGESLATGLGEAHRALEGVAAHLGTHFPQLDPDLVSRVVFESYAALARTRRIGAHVVALAENFARQRLEDIAKVRGAGGRPQVLFVCVQNAGRSQLAAAITRKHAGDAVVVRSAGTTPAAAVHDHVRTVLTELGVGPDAFPKPLTDDAVRAADVIVTMGCGDTCPYYPGKRYVEWVVGDPALASLEGVRGIAADIDTHVRELLTELLPASATAG